VRVSAPFDHPDTLVVVSFQIVISGEVLLDLKTEMKLQDLPQKDEP
jgi:hypothetical protein